MNAIVATSNTDFIPYFLNRSYHLCNQGLKLYFEHQAVADLDSMIWEYADALLISSRSDVKS